MLTIKHNIFTNSPALITDVNVVDNLPSTDHDAIHPSLCLSVQPQKPCHRTLYDYKKADLSELNAVLSHVPWHLIELCEDIEETWTLLKDFFWSHRCSCSTIKVEAKEIETLVFL